MPRKKGSGHSITEGIDLRNKQKAMVSELFMELPNKDDYPDYYLAIKNPVALESIKTRVEQGEYKGDNFTMFGKDLKTLTANAKSYNRQGSIIFKDALTLEIARPMALDGIKQKIDGHEYKTLQDFEDDFDLMFANAKQYNTEGSGVYLDAEELQEHFWKTIGKEKVKPVRRPNSASSSNPLKRQKDQSSFVYHGETYRIGMFTGFIECGHNVLEK
ncbi:transcriptional regulator [Podila horticola]|nr:transcriptional regulator [Podila horticola]